jgi:sugar-specific transcriptional regulator TrmB
MLSVLSVLGLRPAEQDVYRRLVSHAGVDAAGLAALTGRPVADVADVLALLIERGLVAAAPPVDTPGVTAVFAAAPPAIALGGLLRQRRDDLNAAERELAAIVEEHRVAGIGRTTSNVVEEITDIGAVRHRFAQIQETAQHEVLSMVIPNLTVVPHRSNTAGDAGLRRGITHRAILDRKALLQPGMVGDVLASIACGQQVRIADHVPVKMVIVDRAHAMLPLLSGRNNAPESILVGSSGLLDALVGYFESVWEHAHPLVPNATNADLVETRAEIDDLDRRILGLLLCGMTEEAVAGQLGTSRRTVQRRIRELMVKAHADTRIELGWYAARNGWA